MEHHRPAPAVALALTVAAALGSAIVAAGPADAAAGTRTAFTETAATLAYHQAPASPHSTPMTPTAPAAQPQPSSLVSTVRVTVADARLRRGPAACDASPSASTCPTVVTLLEPGAITAVCQRQGQSVTVAGHSTPWWTWVATNDGQSGYVSNAYLTGGGQLAGVPDCSS